MPTKKSKSTKSTGIKKNDAPDSDANIKKAQDAENRLETFTVHYKEAVSTQSRWVDAAKEDLQFYLGEQWKPEEKANLEAKSRPVLTFNKIKPMIQLVVGHYLKNAARIQVEPEGGEDQIFSEMSDRVIRHFNKQSKFEWQMGYQFAGGEKCGRAWIGFYLDYENNPIFGNLKSEYLGPFGVFPDPNGREYDLSSHDYLCIVRKLTRNKLKRLYPDATDKINEMTEDSQGIIFNEDMIKEGDRDNYHNKVDMDSGVGFGSAYSGALKGDSKPFTTVEYWHRKNVKKWFVYFANESELETYDDEETAKAEITKRQAEHQKKVDAGDESAKFEHVIRSRNTTKMVVEIWAGNQLLSEGDSPFEPYYSGFPFFQYIAEWNPESENNKLAVQGLVRSLKDPQREINKARSQFLHILNTSANSGWIGDEAALSPDGWLELKQFGSTPGITVRKQKKGLTLERIHPVEPSLAQQVREKASTDDLKEVSGLNPDLLSVDTKASPSGKAIALRIRQAITILEPHFKNFRYTKREVGNFLFKIIPMMVDEGELRKILGEKWIAESKIDDNVIKLYLINIRNGKYDVDIDEKGNTQTAREETLEDLLSLAQAGMQFPPDLMLEFMNISNKEEVKNRIKEWIEQQQQAEIEKAQAGKKKQS